MVRLHTLMVRVAHAESARRAGLNGITGIELEDLADQAADDATVSVMRKIGEFRGESRFTTWAYKFAVYEVAHKFGRHAWRRRQVQLDDASWQVLPGRLGNQPEDLAASKELVLAVRRAVEQELTPHQRDVFVAIIVHGVPLDALVAELGSNRNAIYKTLFDARRKLRAHLVTHGYIDSRREEDA